MLASRGKNTKQIQLFIERGLQKQIGLMSKREIYEFLKVGQVKNSRQLDLRE